MDEQSTNDEPTGVGPADEEAVEAPATGAVDDASQAPAGANAGTGDTSESAADDDPSVSEPVGSAPDFEQLSAAPDGSQPAALSLLYDLDLPVAIELGRAHLSVQDVLGLARGSVVQLDRQAGEPVDVFVGDRRFAEGEVVIVGEQFGVRITRIVSTVPVGVVAER